LAFVGLNRSALLAEGEEWKPEEEDICEPDDFAFLRRLFGSYLVFFCI
jgi:hypothetical protein